jgi:hypothetical protein
MGKVVAADAVFVLEVADDRFDRGAASHLSLDGGASCAASGRRCRSCPVAQRGIVAAISGIDENALELDPDHRFHVGNDLCQSVAVIGVAGQRLGVEDNWPPFEG